MKEYLKINPADNVAVAISPLTAGKTITVDGQDIQLVTDIPAGHKVALCDIAEGENIIKYGFPIGHARHAIKRGSYLDHQDIKTNLAGQLDYSGIQLKGLQRPQPQGEQLTFEGYVRPDGQVGIRNEVWVIPTVGCVNGIVKQIVDRLNAETGAQGVDGIFGFPHNYGCSQLSEDHENTK
jgi:altronate hydrolase